MEYINLNIYYTAKQRWVASLQRINKRLEKMTCASEERQRKEKVRGLHPGKHLERLERQRNQPRIWKKNIQHIPGYWEANNWHSLQIKSPTLKVSESCSPNI